MLATDICDSVLKEYSEIRNLRVCCPAHAHPIPRHAALWLTGKRRSSCRPMKMQRKWHITRRLTHRVNERLHATPTTERPNKSNKLKEAPITFALRGQNIRFMFRVNNLAVSNNISHIYMNTQKNVIKFLFNRFPWDL